MDEIEFERVADAELRRVLEAVIACSDAVDPDLESGVLTITFEDDTKYIINSHRAARQIWMAAERAAWHFDYVDGRWVAAQSGAELWAALGDVLGRKLGARVELQRG
jgi:CyaY protein